MKEAIQKLLDEHLLTDLQSTLKRRHFYNKCNIVLGYGFEFCSVGGVMINGAGLSTGDQTLSWIGLGLIGVSLFFKNIQKQNSRYLKYSMMDIVKMRNGEYIDESTYVDVSDQKDYHLTPNDVIANSKSLVRPLSARK